MGITIEIIERSWAMAHESHLLPDQSPYVLVRFAREPFYLQYCSHSDPSSFPLCTLLLTEEAKG